MHSGTVDDAYLGSGQILKASVKKHGRDSHVREILHLCETIEEMCKLETDLITQDLIKNPMCMNIAPGGKGGKGYKHTEEMKAHLKEVAQNRPSTHYVKGEDHGMFGKFHTPEVRARISTTAKGKAKPRFSAEHRAKISLAAKAQHARARELKNVAV